MKRGTFEQALEERLFLLIVGNSRFSCLDRGLVNYIFKLAWKSYFRWYASLSSLLGCESGAKEVGLPCLESFPGYWVCDFIVSNYLLPSRNALSWLYVHKFSRISIAIWWVEGGRPSFFSMEARITLDVLYRQMHESEHNSSARCEKRISKIYCIIKVRVNISLIKIIITSSSWNFYSIYRINFCLPRPVKARQECFFFNGRPAYYPTHVYP